MIIFSAKLKFIYVALCCTVIISWFVSEVSAQNGLTCGSYNLQTGNRVTIGNRNYPYYGAQTCRWKFISPANTKLNIQCNVAMPQYYNCAYRLVVSLSGNDGFSDGINYCERHDFNLNSQSNLLSVGLSTMNGENYWYYCEISVVSVTTTPPPAQCDCSWSKYNRIVNGVEARPNEFTFMAALVRKNRQGITCGAVIISNRYSLTAAHCVNNQNIKDYTLRVGVHDILSNTGTNYEFAGYIIHEYYNPTTYANDIAILVTVYPIQYTAEIGPACLPYRYVDVSFTNARVVCMGWGTKEIAGPQSRTLQKVDLMVISNTECQQRYPNLPINSGNLCTYDQTKDACQFDSGGPCVWFDPNNTQRLQLLGLISQGRGCGDNAAGVNTRVGEFVNWIFSRTGVNNYCLK